MTKPLKNMLGLRLDDETMAAVLKLAEENKQKPMAMCRELLREALEMRQRQSPDKLTEIINLLNDNLQLTAGSLVSSAIVEAMHQIKDPSVPAEDASKVFNTHLKSHIDRAMGISGDVLFALRNNKFTQ